MTELRSFPCTRLLLCLLLCSSCVLSARTVWGEEPSIVTFWPLFDYRHSSADEYTSLNLFGPLVKFEQSRHDHRFGVRPLFFAQQRRSGSGASGEFLYPVASWATAPDHSHLQVLHWIEWDSSPHDDTTGHIAKKLTLFPFLFYNAPTSEHSNLALFPLAGRLEGMYGRDRINFFLFPLYARTERHDTEVTNLLWPVFARIQGPAGESGWKAWPLLGWAEKPGVYRKRFFLWPFWTSNDLELNSTAPVTQRTYFPFWSSETSAKQRSQSLLWPFFNHTEDSLRDYEAWEFPWPLVRLTRGETYHGLRLLPFYSDETRASSRKRWWLWPIYNSEQRQTPAWTYRRDRLVYFLYADTREHDHREELPRLHRIDFWPLFHYEVQDGVSSFSTVALMEPFFIGNERIERNWAPLWRIYQTRWDRHGNAVSSLLWNLYWKERRSDGLTWELFPLMQYRRQTDDLLDVSLIKGLVRYRRDTTQGRQLMLLFLPWGIPLGGGPTSPAPLE